MVSIRRRSGFSYLELLVAVVVITVTLAVTSQMVVLVMGRMAANQRRLSALETASSIMEMVVSQPYATVDESSLQLPAVRELIDQNLPDWKVELSIGVQVEPIPSKRIDLRMVRASNSDMRPLVLSTWKHEP